MSENNNVVTIRLPHIAPLRNVGKLRRMMEHLTKRSANLPGIGAFYGEPGVGKSNACAAAAAAYRAVYVEVRSHFTKKALLLALLNEMSIKPERTVSEMVDQVCQELMLSRRPLILDEGDYLVSRNLVEIVRDVYEGSGAAIVMIGEENFPKKLERASARMYGRVLDWQLADFADLEDTRKLARLYSPDVEIRDDLLEAVKGRRGNARWIAVNIDAIREEAKKAGKRVMDLAAWGDRPFLGGEPPRRSS